MPTAFRISYMNEDSGDLIFYESGIPHYNTYCGQKIIFKEYTETGAETKNLTVDLSDEKFMPGMVYRFAVQTYNRFGFSDYSRPSMAIYIPDRAHKSPKEG
ncbi:uncharacterized protein LOC101860726, partial [Aplysia californica]|uniref:Uncharacterized protein LOC101860726 n=1 Tax=Aplysia californica TaxID=6500 RepID=A0ABM0ZVD8_APLCA